MMIDREDIISLRNQVYADLLESNQKLVGGGTYSENYYLGRVEALGDVFRLISTLLKENE